MPPFPKPAFDFSYSVDAQLKALRDYRRSKPGRQIPSKSRSTLLLATWNIANLGVHERRPQDYRLIAEMIRWFDLVAVQEVNDHLSGLRAIAAHLPKTWRILCSDVAGNKERLAYIYDSRKVSLLEKVGEVAIPPSQQRHITLPGIAQQFNGFDRHPYIAGFAVNGFRFVLVNVHLFFGSESARSMNRRSLEAFAVGRWADLRRKNAACYAPNIIALGDFNLPKRDPDDPIYQALTKRGLELPSHSSEVGSNLRSDKHYDQIAFFPGSTRDRYTGRSGVFDFDGALFKTLWQQSPPQFFDFTRYYISDHRPLWAQFAA
jgi:endonuclease/exonuclease/phosphatase family metal-dependent hydrolase